MSKLVKTENYPRIFDDIDDVKNFYESRSNNAVKTNWRYLSNDYKAGKDNVIEYKKAHSFFYKIQVTIIA